MYCAICKGGDYVGLFRKNSLTLVKCLGCGLVHVDNLSATFDIKHYDYYKERMKLSDDELYSPITTKRYIKLLNRLGCYRGNNALLDIGCGEGHFLSVAKKMGWQAQGLEKAPYALEICKRFNVNAMCADLLEVDLADNSYDIVMMSEVLEHLTQPREYLLKVNRILRKGGILRITTPNFNCITRFLLQDNWSLIYVEHLFYFTPKTLKSLLRKCNFKIIELRTKLITLPELRRLFTNKADDTYGDNQAIRKMIEENKFLSFLKNCVNTALDLTKMGESIECVCQKI